MRCYGSRSVSFTPLVVYCVIAAVIAGASGQDAQPEFKRYKFLYFAFEKLGSHGMQVSQSGKVLARQGHEVTFLLGSDGPRKPKVNDEDLFSFTVFRSNYTAQARREVWQELSRLSLAGEMNNILGIAKIMYRSIVTGKPPVIHLLVEECDSLLSDTETMAKLRQEKFDMMVADDLSLCNPILAEALDIPFVQSANFASMPEMYGPIFQVPNNPSYIPGRLTGFSDKMTLLQRLQNVLHHIWNRMMTGRRSLERYQQLKVKHNIKPEIDIHQSAGQAKLWFFNSNYPMEFPRPMHPNTIMATSMVGGPRKNVTLADDVAEFIETAPGGVVIFSFGTHVLSMRQEQAQMFADGLALVPQRVLWQTSADLSSIALGKNTKVVKWLPLGQLMEHNNVKVLVTHGGVNCVIEATWAGLPIVGVPLFFDQIDNVARAVTRGYGVALNDITQVTSVSLRDAINTVVNDPKFRENAKRASAIMRDLTAGTPPAETIAHWILHVTKFGDDHLRPAVFDLNFFQKNLLDVYLVFLLVTTGVVGTNVYMCYMCCLKRRGHAKRD